MRSSPPALIGRFALTLVMYAATTGHGAAQDKPPASWDGPLLKPVDREAVYEFTRAPTVKRAAADWYEISFACQ